MRARLRFSINGLFVRFTVGFVLDSGVLRGDVAFVDDDGDAGVAEFVVVVFVGDEFEFESIDLVRFGSVRFRVCWIPNQWH